MIAEVSKLRNETAKALPAMGRAFGDRMAGLPVDPEAYDSFASRASETSFTPGVPSTSRTLTRFLEVIDGGQGSRLGVVVDAVALVDGRLRPGRRRGRSACRSRRPGRPAFRPFRPV